MKKLLQFRRASGSFFRLCLCVGLLMGATSVSAQSISNKKVTLDFKDAPIINVLLEIQKQTEASFAYEKLQIEQLKPVTIHVKDRTLEETLKTLLEGTGYTYKIADNVIAIIKDQEKGKISDSMVVSGRVVDEQEIPLPGVTVRIIGTSMGTATNANGEFSIDLPVKKGRLEFSFVGFKKQQVAFSENENFLQITMQEDVLEIDEVVVTGIFNKPKESFTGSVTSVTKEDLKINYSRNILQTLSNLDPSLRIIQNNEAGSNPNTLPEIRLRGTSTLLSYEEMRAQNSGDAVTDYNRPLFIMDGFEVDLERVMDMNENEIENITILKDASATSLYGSRGANGVIVITTRRFTSGNLRVMYEGRINLQIPDFSTYDNLMTAEEKFEYEKEIGVWDSELYQELYDEVEANIAEGVNYDWLKEPTRTGVGQYHILQISGGMEGWNYSMDLSYQVTNGAMKGSDRKNFNGTMSLGYRTDKWNIWQSLSVGTNTSQDSPYGEFWNYVNMNRYWEPYEENGDPVEYFYHPNSGSGYPITNPLYDKSKGVWRKVKYFNMRSNTRLRYNIAKGFYADVTFGISRRDQNSDAYYPPSHNNFATTTETEQKGSFDRGELDQTTWNARGVLSYAKTFKDRHMLTTGLSAELNESIEDRIYWRVVGFAADNIDHPGLSLAYPENRHASGDKSKVRRVSLSAMANYYFDSRYFVDLSFTYNGSSSFGDKSRFSPYYSVGAGWEMANERFIQNNLPFINELRLRYAFGVSGNATLSPQEYMEVFNRNSQDLYLEGICWTLSNFANPYLKQQNSLQHNAGFNLGLFNNRISVDFNYYNYLTNNALTDINLPISHGFSIVRGNMGKIRNEGFEWYLSFLVLEKDQQDFRWYVNANITRHRNTIVELSEAFKEALEPLFLEIGTVTSAIKYKEGQSSDAIYGLYSLGIDPVSGQRVFRTKDGQSTLEQNAEDLVYLGDSQPKFNSTFNTTVSWKNLSLTVGFLARWGGKQVNYTELNKGENVGLTHNLDRRVLKYGWKQPGDQALYKNQWGETSRSISTPVCSDFVHKDNVLSCTNVNVRYSFPTDWLKRHIGLESLSVSADLSDLFYWSTIERERGTNYPFTINPNFSISCTF